MNICLYGRSRVVITDRNVLLFEWIVCAEGHTVERLVETLCYKLEGHRFNSRWLHWDFSLT
jgi:hypothetical protein